ncbi:helix-turn-helix domain-containing protein [Paraglaciecola sp. 2405UD69-4]|uniref:helix-turn-helix domain-containing protein n=1 Tax=Paraglaciecola sp. 2405UD69-4 TaxID=3391836 RepID=UPI0039C9E030
MQLWIIRSLLLCLSGYLLLTAPIDNSAYGITRGIFLLLTELLPYFLWAYVFVLFKPDISSKNISWLMKLAALAGFIWFIYFFTVLQGRGSFHRVNHILGILIFAHIAFMAIYDFNDDLILNRRKIRVAIAVFLGAYSSFLATLEIFDITFRGSTLFGVINSGTIFLLILLFIYFLEKTKNNHLLQADPLKETALYESENTLVPIIFRSDIKNLKLLMEQEFYTQSNLTIGVLAKELNMPEHRLRLMINKYMGFQNFSGFLNSYRLLAAKNKLQDQALTRVPILTIALELGYGSIGPFNRVFKQETGLTPSEYRKQFQNRT